MESIGPRKHIEEGYSIREHKIEQLIVISTPYLRK